MRGFLASGATLLLVGCGCRDPEGKDGPAPSGDFADVTCTPGAVAGVAHVSWTTALTGPATVVYGRSEGELSLSTPEVDAAAGAATLLGLRVATPHFAQVVAGDARSEVVACEAVIPPRVTPAFTLVEWNPELACEDGGYVLYSYIAEGRSGVGILDREGKYVWTIASEDPAVQYTRARLGRDGRSILWNTNDAARREDIATIERLAIDGTERTSTRTINGHHDFVELPDGAMAWLSYAFRDVAVEGLPSYPDPDPVAADALYDAPEGITDPDAATKRFDLFDDWPGGLTVSSPEMLDCETGFIPGYCEFSHGNSLAYVEAEDAFYAGFRWLDAIAKFDRAGELRWILGGRENQLAVDPADLPLHMHFSEVWDGGMLVFDNHNPDGPSRVVEYAIHDENLTAEVVWEHPHPEGQLEDILGDARRVPLEGCDNVLISWSGDGVLEEVTRDGRTVWSVKFTNPTGATSRVQYLSSLYDFAAQAYPE